MILPDLVVLGAGRASTLSAGNGGSSPSNSPGSSAIDNSSSFCAPSERTSVLCSCVSNGLKGINGSCAPSEPTSVWLAVLRETCGICVSSTTPGSISGKSVKGSVSSSSVSPSPPRIRTVSRRCIALARLRCCHSSRMQRSFGVSQLSSNSGSFFSKGSRDIS